MVIGAGVAFASTLNVPFFNDNVNQNTNAFIGLKEASGLDQTITIVYTAIGFSGDPIDQTETFFLGANSQADFQPVQVSTAAENEFGVIPDMAIIGTNGKTKNTGSATLSGSSAISGRYLQVTGIGTAQTRFSFVLLP